jgi:uncharacterized repeat protein (TIGR01451 family)
MIHSPRRLPGVRSLVVLTATALIGVVPLFGSGGPARADGPVGSGAERHTSKGGAETRHKTRHLAKLVAKTRSPRVSILPGRTYKWPFAVTNKGAVRAGSVTFAAPLPPSLQFVSGGQNCAWQGTMAVCQLGALSPGQTATGSLAAKVAPNTPAGQTIASTAKLTWRAPKATRASVGFAAVTVAATADVSVTQAGPENVRPGAPIPYKVTVTNKGPAPARMVVLRDSAAIGVNRASTCKALQREQPTMVKEKSKQSKQSKESAAPKESKPSKALKGQSCARTTALKAAPPIRLLQGNAICKPSESAAGPAVAMPTGGTPEAGLVCTLGDMAPGTAQTLAFKVRPTARPGAVVRAPAQVSTSTIELQTANNSASANTRVSARPVTHVARAPVPSKARAEAPGGAPSKGITELPRTGAPNRFSADLALGLIGVGLILYRLGRPRRARRAADCADSAG